MFNYFIRYSSKSGNYIITYLFNQVIITLQVVKHNPPCTAQCLLCLHLSTTVYKYLSTEFSEKVGWIIFNMLFKLICASH